jgi:hypothetical protein
MKGDELHVNPQQAVLDTRKLRSRSDDWKNMEKQQSGTLSGKERLGSRDISGL